MHTLIQILQDTCHADGVIREKYIYAIQQHHPIHETNIIRNIDRKYSDNSVILGITVYQQRTKPMNSHEKKEFRCKKFVWV